MEASIIYTILPLLGATCGGFVLRDIYEYIEDAFYFSSNDYVKYDIHLDELPQLLDYNPIHPILDETSIKPKQNNMHLNAICGFDRNTLRKKEDIVEEEEQESKCNDEQDIIAELRKRLKVIRKYTEEP